MEIASWAIDGWSLRWVEAWWRYLTSSCVPCAVAGCVVKHWGPLLASSRAQQQLFRLVEVLLLPHSLTHLEQALRDSLPLYLQVTTSLPTGNYLSTYG